MNKNKILSIISALIFGTTFTSCTDWLDVKPEGEIVLDDFWQNKSQVEGMLATCYKSFTSKDCSIRMLLWGELRGDNVVEGQSVNGEVKKMLEVDIDPENWVCDYASMYTVINYCNTFIANAPSVPAIDPNFTVGECNSMIGEIRALRALAYFYLVRTYKEVLYRDEPSVSDNQDYNKAKSSEDYVLDKIIADLLAAEPVVRTQFESTRHTKGRITKNGVRAILADVYLWRSQYNECVTKCNQILADTTITLVKDFNGNLYSNIFGSGNSKESIFELQYNSDINWNEATKGYYGTAGNMDAQQGELFCPQYMLTPGTSTSPFAYIISAKKKESEEDQRKKYSVIEDEQSGTHLIFKYAGNDWTEGKTSNYYSYRSSTSNWIVYRLPDIMLMKAEALCEIARTYESTNDDSENTDEPAVNPNQDKIDAFMEQALELVNKTYVRANPKADELEIEDYPAISNMSSLVLRERHRELIFEGKRWFDLMRLARRGKDGEGDPMELVTFVLPKLTKDEAMQKSKMSVMNALYLPIPQKEMNVNKLMVQNPFYKSSGGGSTIN